MKVWNVCTAVVTGILLAPVCSAVDPHFIVDDQVGQATGSTCQSYVLAVGLAFKRDSAFPVRSWAELRQTEVGIRNAIVAAAGGRKTTHEHIKIGFEKYTSGVYTLEIKDVDIAGLSALVEKRTGVTAATQVPADFFLSTAVKDVVMSSALVIGGDSYPDGHLFTIFGMDGPPNSSRRYLILNSGVKHGNQTRNVCENGFPDDPGPFTASLSWRTVGDIKLKYFGDKLKVWFIQKQS